MKLLTSLRLNFCHLNEHNSSDIINPMYSCGAGIATTGQYLLRCQNCALVRSSFLNRIFENNVEFRNINDLIRTSLLLYGSEKQTFDVNTKILNLTIKFLKDSGRFDEFLI